MASTPDPAKAAASEATKRLLTGAVGFLVAAEETHKRRARDPDEVEFWPAISVNICFAFELSLKAFLTSRGASDKALRAIGHDLKRGLAEAHTAGYRPIHPAVADLIEILSPLHKDHSLRYLEDKSVDLPDTRNMIAIAHRHIEGVGAQIPIHGL